MDPSAVRIDMYRVLRSAYNGVDRIEEGDLGDQKASKSAYPLTLAE